MKRINANSKVAKVPMIVLVSMPRKYRNKIVCIPKKSFPVLNLTLFRRLKVHLTGSLKNCSKLFVSTKTTGAQSKGGAN